MNWLDKISNGDIIQFVLTNKGRCNDITVQRIEEGRVVVVTTEIWDRYDDNDITYQYFYNSFGEMEKTDRGLVLKAFNEDAKQWCELMLDNIEYAKQAYLVDFKDAHTDAIEIRSDLKMAELSKQIEELKAEQKQVEVKETEDINDLIKFFNNAVLLEKNKPTYSQGNSAEISLLVKDFLMHMPADERKKWIYDNLRVENVSSSDSCEATKEDETIIK